MELDQQLVGIGESTWVDSMLTMVIYGHGAFGVPDPLFYIKAMLDVSNFEQLYGVEQLMSTQGSMWL